MSLQVLHYNNFPKLMKVLISKFPASCQVYHWLRVQDAWKNKMSCVQLQVLCPRGNFSSGAVVAFCQGMMPKNEVYMVAFADEKNTDDLMRALRETTLIPWSSVAVVSEVQEPLTTCLRDIFTQRQITFTCPQYYMYYMTPETVMEKFKDVKVPDGVRVGQLEEKHVDTLCKDWQYYTDKYRPLISSVMKHNLTIGLYIEDELVMRVVESWDGHMGMLFTSPQHRNKGLATIGTKHMLLAMAQRGTYPHLCVHIENQQSINFFEKNLGFGKPTLLCNYIDIY